MRPDFVFEIQQIYAQPVREEPDVVLKNIATICDYYQVSAIAADGNGNGTCTIGFS